MKILVTGFGSFPGVAENPSELLVKQLQSHSFESSDIDFHLFPVDYQLCQEWFLTTELNYDLVIHIGVAVNSSLNRLELQAKNKCGNSPDVRGYVHQELIVANGSANLASGLALVFCIIVL